MNFFERQAAARRTTRRLIVLFGAAVLAIVLVVDAAVLFALGLQVPSDTMQYGGVDQFAAAHAGLLAVTSLATLAVIGAASLVRIGSLRAGGAAVAQRLGGSRVEEDTRDPQLKRLRNVVEEIAIAASTPVPEIFVLNAEPGINAFAAGYSTSDAAIAVTRGALEQLNRDELQGVIAHEFSHLLNGDTRLNIQLMGLLFGILVLGVTGRKVLQFGRRGRDSKEAGAVLLIALVLLIVGYVGVFFGRLIKAGVSRSREYLADASAVQFTRQTRGIAGALKKIAGVQDGSRLGSGDTEEVSHMLFGDGIGYSRLWATHPPLVDRIRALDPAFDPRTLVSLRQQWRTSPPSGLLEDQALGLDAPRASLTGTSRPSLPLASGTLHQQAGRFDAGIDEAARIHAALPAKLVDAAHAHDGAMALLLALLLDGDAGLREQQRDSIASGLGAAVAEAALALQPQTAALHPLLRLPLASLAFPALRQRPAAELDRFVATCDALIHADGAVGLFEYCLGRLLERQVVEALDPARRRPDGRRKLAQSRDALRDLFAVLAEHGHGDRDAARRAFVAGLHVVLPNEAFEYRPPRDWVAALDRSLDEIDRLAPLAKQMLVDGLAEACSHDGRISVAEAELLRTVCACLHCPLPPLLGGR